MMVVLHAAFWVSNVYVFLWHLLHPDAQLLEGSGKFGWFFRVSRCPIALRDLPPLPVCTLTGVGGRLTVPHLLQL